MCMRVMKTTSIMRLKVAIKKEITDTDVEAFFEKTATPFGSGAKIDCPKEHLGKQVYVIIRKQK